MNIEDHIITTVTKTSINNDFRVEFIEKKSRFIGSIRYSANEQEAKEYINSIRIEFPDATHNVWAFRVEDNRELFSDDGEPSGSAGKPVLKSLTSKNLRNIVAVVTRYYGGIKLGVGGLMRAYSRACDLAIQSAEIKKYIPAEIWSVNISYTFLGSIDRFVGEHQGLILERSFTEFVGLKIILPFYKNLIFKEFIKNITRGNLAVEPIKNDFLEWS